MIAFREKLLHEPVPSNLTALVKNLVPPQGIRRKNVEGSELLEYMDDERAAARKLCHQVKMIQIMRRRQS